MNMQDEQKLAEILVLIEDWFRTIAHGTYDDVRIARLKLIEYIKREAEL